MEIWEPKPPTTFWATPGLLRDCFIFYIRCIDSVYVKYIRGLELLIVAAIYLQLIQNRYMFRSFTLLQCSHQHCVKPVAGDVEVVGYL